MKMQKEDANTKNKKLEYARTINMLILYKTSIRY